MRYCWDEDLSFSQGFNRDIFHEDTNPSYLNRRNSFGASSLVSLLILIGLLCETDGLLMLKNSFNR